MAGWARSSAARPPGASPRDLDAYEVALDRQAAITTARKAVEQLVDGQPASPDAT